MQRVPPSASKFSSRARLCLPPTLASFADVAMTLRGQPVAYWAGGFDVTNEFNPVARALLELHPLAFVTAAVGSAVLVAVLTLYLSRPLARGLAFVVTFGHALAAAAWMVHGAAGVTPAGLAGAVAVLAAAERLWAWADDRTHPFPNFPSRLSATA